MDHSQGPAMEATGQSTLPRLGKSPAIPADDLKWVLAQVGCINKVCGVPLSLLIRCPVGLPLVLCLRVHTAYTMLVLVRADPGRAGACQAAAAAPICHKGVTHSIHQQLAVWHHEQGTGAFLAQDGRGATLWLWLWQRFACKRKAMQSRTCSSQLMPLARAHVAVCATLRACRHARGCVALHA